MTEKFPDIGNYNRGNVLYRKKDYQGAEKAFANAAALTQDEKLKQRALYNRGTALLAGTTLQTNAVADIAAQSADIFEQALALKPADSDAKQNFERAINLIMATRIQGASKLIQEADASLTQYKAKTAKENYTKAKELLAPVLADFSPASREARNLTDRADGQIQMLEQAINDTRTEMETAEKAIAVYEYKTAADIMLTDTDKRKLAFDLDDELKEKFTQLIQNNQKVIQIVYPNNPLKP